jgi:hypothetical protein
MSIEKNEEIENKSKGEEIVCYCNQCKNDIKHIILQGYYQSKYKSVDFSFNIKGERVDSAIEWETDHQIIQCLGCDTVSYRTEEWISEYQDDENTGFFYEYFPEPENGKLSIDIKNAPELIHSIISESINAFNNKYYLLCAAGLRMVIESICKDKNINKGKVNKNDKTVKSNTLEGKINGLHEHGYITEDQSSILHIKTIYELPKEGEKITRNNESNPLHNAQWGWGAGLVAKSSKYRR